MELKIFSARTGCANEIEEQVNKYLAQHPGSYIQSQALASNQYNTILSVVFDDGVVHVPYLPNIDPGFAVPYGPIGPAITKEGPSDDPWHGEYIPIGDPPMKPVRYQDNHTSIIKQ